jgi:hypothetical protein
VAWAAVAGTLLACTVAPGGLLSRGWAGDVIYYSRIGERIVHGAMPYHQFFLEYPPGSIPAFVLPALFSHAHYILLFKLLMAGCAAIAVVAALATADRIGVSDRDRVRAALVLATAPVALGPLFLNRYDLWPAMLVSLAVLAFVAERPRIGFAILGFAIVAKIYPLAILPVAAVHVYRTRGRRELQIGLAVLAAVACAVVLPFAAVGFGGLGFSFYIQATRHLQVESLGAQLLVALHHLGLYSTHTIVGSPGSFDLPGRLPDAVGFLSSAIEVAAVVLVALWYARGNSDAQRLVLACAAAVAAFVAFGKVLSPQYLVWLVPLVPLVASRRGAVASVMLVAALLMTQLTFYESDGVADLRTVSWLVLARNVVLVALFVVLARPLAEDART